MQAGDDQGAYYRAGRGADDQVDVAGINIPRVVQGLEDSGVVGPTDDAARSEDQCDSGLRFGGGHGD